MKKILVSVLFCVLASISISAQTTEFTYQGSLKNSGLPANGNFDFEFALFDSLAGGLQLGTTLTRNSIAVANGTFAVNLDFGGQFPGANRFLEIRVRQAGGGAFTTLSPRQSVGSSPYAVQSLNATNATTANTATSATQLGGVAANQYVVTTDPRMTDARPPTAGSSDYIQNGISTQASSNFNISGNGTVGGTLSSNVVSAVTQYNIGADRILSNAGNNNLFAGVDSGSSNTTGGSNSFFGRSSGSLNTTGTNNSFFGRNSGAANTTGGSNSFFGLGSGDANTIGAENAFFGRSSGGSNTTGNGNAFFGMFSGALSTTGTFNSFFGRSSGGSNTTGSNNTLIGFNADVPVGSNLSFATAIGSDAIVTTSNSVVLGRSNDHVGIGTTAPTERLHIATNSGNMLVGGGGCPSGNVAIGLNGAFGNCTEYTVRGDGSSVYINRPTGGFVFFREGNGGSQVLINPGGALELRVLGAAGGTALCRNATQEVAFCSSSLRYKKNISPFAAGMSLVRQLQPIAYEWKDGGMKDVGFGAEDVALIDPRFVTYNDKGEVEGVKYDRLSVAFVNAFKEQQKTIESQQMQIDALKKLVCLSNKDAEICMEN